VNEAETRAEHIDPALKAAGWGVVEGSRIRREYPISPGRIEGHGKRGKPLTADYVLEFRNTKLGVVEAKALDEELTEGVAQAKNYAGNLFRTALSSWRLIETGHWKSKIVAASSRGHAAGGMVQPGCFVFARNIRGLTRRHDNRKFPPVCWSLNQRWRVRMRVTRLPIRIVPGNKSWNRWSRFFRRSPGNCSGRSTTLIRKSFPMRNTP
jgi:type I site-specific restriction endonuclease